MHRADRSVLHLPGPGGPARVPVVAVPGLGLSVEVPARALRHLRDVVGSTVLALPGYGVPPGRGPALDPPALDPPALATRLLERLDGLAVGRAVLLGHSASCQVVVEAARQDPARVAAAVLVGPTTDPRAAGWPTLAARWVRTAAWERPGQIPLLVRSYGRTGLAAMSRAMDAARRHRLDAAVADLTCPVLVVRGRHDRIAPADWVAALARHAPDGRAATLPVGAHMVPITHPTALAAAVSAFAAGVGPPAPPP